jgi:hypothetical protein
VALVPIAWNTGRSLRVLSVIAIAWFIYSTGDFLHVGVRTQRLLTTDPDLAPPADLSPVFDNLVAQSQLRVELLHNQLAGAPPSARPTIRRAIAAELESRQKLLDARTTDEVERYAESRKQLTTP